MSVADRIILITTVTVSLFSVLERIVSTMLVPSAMAMAVVVEKKEAKHVGNKTPDSNPEHEHRI